MLGDCRPRRQAEIEHDRNGADDTSYILLPLGFREILNALRPGKPLHSHLSNLLRAPRTTRHETRHSRAFVCISLPPTHCSDIMATLDIRCPTGSKVNNTQRLKTVRSFRHVTLIGVDN